MENHKCTKLETRKMSENARVVGEQRRLETNMNAPPVDNNLYVHSLRSRNIPYDT